MSTNTEKQKKSTNLLHINDTSGCGMWRGLFQQNLLWADNLLRPNDVFIENHINPTIINSRDYYKDINSIMIQRGISKSMSDCVDMVYKPAMDLFGGYIVYNIDDCMSDDDIPLYNRGRHAYSLPETKKYIQNILDKSDILLVTTSYIKDYYNDKYGVPLSNIIIIPNMLPRYWIDGLYDKEKSIENFRKNKNKPRVGIISSLSHYNIQDVHIELKSGRIVCKDKKNQNRYVYQDNNEEYTGAMTDDCLSKVEDDLSAMIPLIKSTKDDFRWVIIGYCPEELKGIVETVGVTNILNYPKYVSNLKLNAIVAPLRESRFNYCKSNIKYLEACALGVPLFASDCIVYNENMPAEQLFSTYDDLKTKLYKLRNASSHVFGDIIERQHNYLNKPWKDKKYPMVCIKNWWLDDNIDMWKSLYKLPTKTRELSLGLYESKKANEENKKVISADNGVEVTF